MSADYRLVTSSPIEVRQDPATGDVVIRNIHDPHSAIVATGDEWAAFADQMSALQGRTAGETVPSDGRQRVPYVFNLDESTGEVTYREWAGTCAADSDGECTCEAYDCAGECCGVGNCMCTPAVGDPHPRGDGPAPVLTEGAIR